MPDTPPRGNHSEELEVTVEHEPGDGRAVLRVAGDVDSASADELTAAVERVVAGGATEVRFDLTAVPFMDSTGLTVLIAAGVKLEGRGEVVVESASPSVRRTLQIAGLDAFFGTA